MISYDLMAPGQNYTKLDNYIRRMGGKEVLRSQWVVESNADVTTLWRNLSAEVDNNDKLLVTELTRNAQWRKGALLIPDAEMTALLAKARC